MNKVLITGVTGLIGKHLMYKLLEQGGFQIRGQYVTPRDITDYTALGVEMFQADICRRE